jgi:esterase/lipase superfamily enzyme
MRLKAVFGVLACLGGAVLLTACSPEDGGLAPTPTIFASAEARAMVDSDHSINDSDNLNLLYVTDRAPIADPETGALTYGSDRSRSISFGSIDLRVEPGSNGATGELKLGEVKEIGRFPETPYAAESTAAGYRRAQGVVAAHEQAVASLQGEIRRRLEKTNRKEVVVFIHGYNNTFKDAAFAMGNICRFLGRDFVCVALTWPAGGSRGVFMGYNVDRESGEFAVADMKKAIRAIGETPGVRGVHFIAHSRGTDVLTSAFQQLGLEAYVSRSSLVESLKAKDVILFAPDIDIDVASTKMFGLLSDPDAPYGAKKAPNGTFKLGSFHVTIYSSPEDKALGLATALFGSTMRLGQQNLGRPDASAMGVDPGHAGLADFIEVDASTDTFGHGYFLSNPAVSSDLVAMIRYGLKPGDPGRPLVEIKKPYWRISNAQASAQ